MTGVPPIQPYNQQTALQSRGKPTQPTLSRILPESTIPNSRSTGLAFVIALTIKMQLWPTTLNSYTCCPQGLKPYHPLKMAMAFTRSTAQHSIGIVEGTLQPTVWITRFSTLLAATPTAPSTITSSL